MKEKIIAFFKKPLNIIAVAAIFLGVLGIILTCSISTGTYYGEFVEGSGTLDSKLELKNGKADVFINENGEWYSQTEGVGLEYKIEKGKLLIKQGTDFEEFATINGITCTPIEESGFKTCTNRLALAFLIVSCVFVVGGAGLVVYSVVADKKKKVA